MRKLSLHHLVLPELSAEALVRLAGELGCEHVCLFTQMPGDAAGLPVVGDGDLKRLGAVMRDVGVSAYGVTSFPLAPATDISVYRAGLERGAELGASRANVRILDPDPHRAADRFAQFGDLCRAWDILPCIEFTGFDAPAAVPQTLDIIRQAGCGALTLDALHVVRTRTPWTILEALEPTIIGYVQVCDGPLAATAADYEREGPLDRLPPGDGEFPLAALLSLVPQDMALCLETPSLQMRNLGLPPGEIAARIVSRTRRWLADLSMT
jgi:sugar phosphate isomerase/epimerase